MLQQTSTFTTKETTLSAEDLSFSYETGKEIIHKVSFNLARGESCGLLGPNGAGKTTLISLFTTLLSPQSGKLSICGYHPQKEKQKIRQLIGIVPQDLAVYEGLSGRENIHYFGTLYGIDKKELHSRCESFLDRFGLLQYGDKLVRTYSGGMKRRLNIILGMIHNPRLLFLDEPTVGIDTQSRNLIVEILHKVTGGELTMIYTTHHIEEVERLCNRVAILDHGKILADGSPASLLAAREDCSNLESLFLHLTGKDLRDI